ncbi:MAG: ATP synthase F1, gamma subunit [Piptocephalis tieghemiana]|nr:MAG: ATP synthase F1, gamma subunit [Piptocephalis tieghemiana]
MFSLNATATTAGRTLSRQTPQVFGVQARNMATLREIQGRLKSVSNISKITKSMKMIASTKMTRAQRNMESARVYGKANNELFRQAEAESNGDQSKTLYIVSSSDRGLCGGIHSSVTKFTKAALGDAPSSPVVVLGDKAKGPVNRVSKNGVKLSFNQLGKGSPTFAESSAIADEILESGIEFDQAKIVYNHFDSAIAYTASTIPAFSVQALKDSGKFAQYEMEDDVLDNLAEFSFANAIHWALTEGHASEMAAKMTAMENATKNAGEMIDKLTLSYNRGRQAVITNELIDIITGASAL